MQKLALQEKIPSEKRRYCVPGTMKSFKVQTPLEVEDKIDEIVESLSINRFREFNPVLGISRIKDSEVHITDDMEHVDNIEEEEGVVCHKLGVDQWSGRPEPGGGIVHRFVFYRLNLLNIIHYILGLNFIKPIELKFNFSKKALKM